MNDNTVIKLDGLTKVFLTDEVETHALSGIHLEIKRGHPAAGSRRCCRFWDCSILQVKVVTRSTAGPYRNSPTARERVCATVKSVSFFRRSI
jgi:hypothetical protein